MYVLISLYVLLTPEGYFDGPPKLLANRNIVNSEQCKFMLSSAAPTIERLLSQQFPDRKVKHEERCVTTDEVDAIAVLLNKLEAESKI